MKKITLIIITLIAVSFNSCKEEDCLADPVPTKYEILTSGIWTGVEKVAYVNGSPNTTTDISERELALVINGQFIYFDNGDIDDNGNWSLAADEQSIILFGANHFNILSLTAHELHIKGSVDSGGAPITLEMDYTFTK
jgi:hypothetical protein